MDCISILLLYMFLIMDMRLLHFDCLEPVVLVAASAASIPAKETLLSKDTDGQTKFVRTYSQLQAATKCSFYNSQCQVSNGMPHRQGKVRRKKAVDSEGLQMSPQLTLLVMDILNNSLTSGNSPPVLHVGDYIRFVIQLTKDNIYTSLEVLACTMSTSPIMPDSKAQTRALLVNGCPLQDEATARSWYWTSEMSTPTTFITRTQPVRVFQLSSSENVYLHCSMKLCFTGSAPCYQPTAANCTALQGKRKRRHSIDLLHRYRKDASADGVPNVNETFALKVIKPAKTTTSNNFLEIGGAGYIILIVLLTLIGVGVLILIAILVIAFFWRRSLNCRQEPEQRPQQFGRQRITPSKRRCCACL